MKKFRLLSKGAAFVPTTSMADIAFLLIIFFMVTAEFSSRRGMFFNLPPDAIGESSPEDAHPMVLDLDAGGRIRIDGVPADLADIKRALLPKLEASPNQWIIIRASGETVFGSVVEVLDQVKQLGAKNIAMPTRAEFVALERQAMPAAATGGPR